MNAEGGVDLVDLVYLVDLVDLVDLDGRLETEVIMTMRQRKVSAFPNLSHY